MNKKQPNLPIITKELLDALDILFPDKTPEITQDIKDIHYQIGQRSVVRFLHKKYAEQSINILEKK
jgi:hypothetical protein